MSESAEMSMPRRDVSKNTGRLAAASAWASIWRAAALVLFPVVAIACVCQAAATQEPSSPGVPPRELVLSGDDWRIVCFDPGQGITHRAFAEGYPAAEAIAATVPGDVHWDLERIGKIPPIYYGLNSQKSEWVAGKEWWYRKTFTTPPQWQGKTVRLRFDGVDYRSEVWLNGRQLGRHEGQFTPFEYDVTQLLRREKDNVLSVLIHPGPESVRQAIAERQAEWPVMGVVRAAYPCWKAATTAGWDWGVKIIAMGIWKDVRLLASVDVYLATPIVLPKLSAPYDEATLETRLTVSAERPRSVELNYRVRCLTAADQPVVASQNISLAAGTRQVALAIKVPHPQLWWPNGYGKQHRYELEITAQAPESGKSLHAVRTTFGIRDLQMLSNPEPYDPRYPVYWDWGPNHTGIFPIPKDDLPEHKYLMQINGRRVFARGGNWIPCDFLYGRPRKPRYEYFIRSAAEANFNLFRVWGGGVIEKADFFELCDQYGIMLFQEFPWEGRPYETSEAVAIAGRETREVLPLLMNHPSVVRYGGGNELYLNARNSRQMAQLRAICNQVDPTRPFHDPDPETMFQRHGDYQYEDPYSYFYLNYRQPRINGSGPANPMEWNEFGVAGAASVESLGAMMPAADLWPIAADNPSWTWHKGINAYGPHNWLGRPGFTRLFGDSPDLPTLVRHSQFAQAEGLRYACQSMRRFRWHRSSCAMWVYNEPWPNAAHDAIVEYYGRKPMAYYYLKQAYAPVDVLAVYSNLDASVGNPLAVELWATNDHLQPLAGYHCRYRITDVGGKLLAEKQVPAEVPAEGNIKIGEIPWRPPMEMANHVVLVWLDLLDAGGKAVAQHLYTFGVTGDTNVKPPPLLADLLRTPRTALKSQVVGRSAKANGETDVTIEIRNSGQSPALFVKTDVVTPDGTDPAKIPLLDWVSCDENYFSLLPGEARRVRITLAPQAPKQPAVRIEAWNADAIGW
jgi:beta-mannosidase